MGKTWEIGIYTFPVVWVLFSHPIPILWFTSLHGKCLGFHINIPQHGKMQQNPSYGENIRNWYPYVSHSMGSFFPSDSYSLVYLITWEMLGFSHQYPIAWENVTKPMVWGKPGKLIFILFPQYGFFFPIRFPSSGILHYMRNTWVSPSVSHRLAKCNKTHCMGKTWEIGIHTFPRVLFPMLYHIIWEMNRFSHEFLIAWQNVAKPILWERPGI